MKFRRLLAWLAPLLLTCWGAMAIVYSNLPAGLRYGGAAAFAILALLSLTLPRKGSRKAVWFGAVFAPALGWWLALPPSNDRDWAPDVALLPGAEVSASSVTLRDIRDCAYRAEYDYDVRHYDRAFELDDLRTLDLFLVDWGAPHIAHTMLSFGFGGGRHVCFSIETRKKKGELYSSVRGFFKQYELTYVVADERDVILLRAAHRKGEDIYLYRLKVPPEQIRRIFLDYLRTVNEFRTDPQWYNALTSNCTTDIWKHITPYYPRAKFDWRILASGYADEMAYDLGVTDQSLPFAELRRRSRVNERAVAAGRDPGFSGLIRRGLPGFGRARTQ
jgi:hypothetical protein